MTVTKIIDHRKTPPALPPGTEDMPPIAIDMASHMVTVAALGLAIAKYAAAAMSPEQTEAFIADFAILSEKMALQYNSAGVAQGAAGRVGEIATQLRAVRS